jgi:hypothetical protein
MNLTPRQGDNQSPRPNPHAPTVGIYLILSITLSMTRVIDFDPAILEALAYLALAECHLRAYR